MSGLLSTSVVCSTSRIDFRVTLVCWWQKFLMVQIWQWMFLIRQNQDTLQSINHSLMRSAKGRILLKTNWCSRFLAETMTCWPDDLQAKWEYTRRWTFCGPCPDQLSSITTLYRHTRLHCITLDGTRIIREAIHNADDWRSKREVPQPVMEVSTAPPHSKY